MTEKELRKLNRKQLLELLLEQTVRISELEQTVEQLEERLADRTIRETQAGSIAEAALRLNGIFEAAQAAADQYIENVKRQAEGGTLTVSTPTKKNRGRGRYQRKKAAMQAPSVTSENNENKESS